MYEVPTSFHFAAARVCEQTRTHPLLCAPERDSARVAI
jgi:hypothetical protein